MIASPINFQTLIGRRVTARGSTLGRVGVILQHAVT